MLSRKRTEGGCLLPSDRCASPARLAGPRLASRRRCPHQSPASGRLSRTHGARAFLGLSMQLASRPGPSRSGSHTHTHTRTRTLTKTKWGKDRICNWCCFRHPVLQFWDRVRQQDPLCARPDPGRRLTAAATAPALGAASPSPGPTHAFPSVGPARRPWPAGMPMCALAPVRGRSH